MQTREAVIVDAVRTPLGRRDGMLKSWHPVDLLAHTLRGLVDRNRLDPTLIDDVICGCVMQVGEQGVNVGRNAVLAAGFQSQCPQPPWTGNAVQASRLFTLQRRE